MKKLFISALLISSTYLFAQNNQVLLQSKQLNSSIILKNTKLNFSQLQSYSKYDFSIFNKTSMLNDNFSVYKDKIEYKNSIIIPNNQIFNTKMDSFNPNASSSIETAVLSGTLNLFAGLFNHKISFR